MQAGACRQATMALQPRVAILAVWATSASDAADFKRPTVGGQRPLPRARQRTGALSGAP